MFSLSWNKSCVVAVLSVGVLMRLPLIAPAQAHQRDFPFTYDWKQPTTGEKEFESQTRYRGSDHTLEQQLELEYGVNRRWMIAPYLVFQREAGDHLRYAGWKLESRYQLGRYKTGKWLAGLYAEYEKPSGETGEGEAKLLLSRYDKHGGDFSVTLIVERPLSSGARFAKTYSFGYARPLGHNRYLTRGGLEWVRDIDDGRINAGPTLALAPTENTWLVLGYGFPLNGVGNNRGELRLLAEYEWF